MTEKEQGWQQLEQNAEKIMNELKLGEKGLDIQKQNVIKGYILGIGQMITQIFITGMKLPGGGTIIKGFKYNVLISKTHTKPEISTKQKKWWSTSSMSRRKTKILQWRRNLYKKPKCLD